MTGRDKKKGIGRKIENRRVGEREIERKRQGEGERQRQETQ